MTATLAATPSPALDKPADPLPHHVRHYPALPRSASAAARDATAQLHRWGLDALIDTATLVVPEMISNAVVSSNRVGNHGADGVAVRVAMRLTYSHQDLIVEVWDSGPDRPTRRSADPEDGRGLNLVAALARDLGYYPVRVRTPDGYRTKGKIVWAALRHDTPLTPHLPNGPAEDLPRRDPPPPTDQGTPNPDSHDHALLQRVLDGLRNLDDWTPAYTTSSSHHPNGTEQEATG
jgi:anti-sigma regulatory factor (Ser/Thr protein kinase)